MTHTTTKKNAIWITSLFNLHFKNTIFLCFFSFQTNIVQLKLLAFKVQDCGYIRLLLRLPFYFNLSLHAPSCVRDRSPLKMGVREIVTRQELVGIKATTVVYLIKHVQFEDICQQFKHVLSTNGDAYFLQLYVTFRFQSLHFLHCAATLLRHVYPTGFGSNNASVHRARIVP